MIFMTNQQLAEILSGNPKDPQFYTAWNLLLTKLEDLTGYKRTNVGDTPITLVAGKLTKSFTLEEALALYSA